MLIPESPSWLIVMGKRDEAKQVFKMVGRINGHQFDDIFTELDDPGKKENKPGLCQLFQNKNIRKNTLAVLIIWLGKISLCLNYTTFPQHDGVYLLLWPCSEHYQLGREYFHF